MSDPTPGELSRRLDEIRTDIRDLAITLNTRLDKLVSIEVHAADLRRIDDRLGELADDVATEREQRKSDIASLTSQMDRTAVWLRWVAAAIVLPIALFVMSLLIDTGATPTP